MSVQSELNVPVGTTVLKAELGEPNSAFCYG